VECIRDLFADVDGQKVRYNKAIEMTEKHHNLQSSTAIFRGVVEKAIEEYKKK
jgi:hypothetical protein